MERKLSYYTIFSDPVNTAGDSIIYGTRSGHAVVISARIRRLLENEQFDELGEETAARFERIKVIVPRDEDELFLIASDNKQTISSSDVLYEVVQPSAMCQLGCDYCGQQHTKNYFPNELFDKLVERITMKANARPYKSLFMGWFGGEPLMALAQIRVLTPRLQMLAEACDMDYGCKIVTNGLSLKKNIFLELVKELGVKHIEVTLDGTAEYHDHRRVTKDGAGATFDIIFNNLLSIFELPDFPDLGCKISLRCNVDGRNVESVSPLIQLLAKHKLQDKIAYFYPIGVYSWGGNDAHFKSLTKEEFAQKEIDWMIEMLEAGFIPSLLPSRQKQVCMAVSPVSEMYDAFGNIYNCTEVSYTSVYENTPYALGNLKKDHATIKTERPLSDWNDTVMTDRFPCHTCRMFPVCGGGCPKSWHEDMRACPTAKFNIKDRLALSYVVANSDLRDWSKEEETETVA